VFPTLNPITGEDESFLLAVYSSTRADEMAMVPWSDEQKNAFLLMQFQAQIQYYRERYPQASFDVIKLDNKSIGRFYVAELDDQIRIIELTILPEHRNKGIGSKLIEEILEKARQQKNPVRIYLENFNPAVRLFSRLGFKPGAEEGIHVLWRWAPDETK
jgi:GNAT superfamily N-acetyltransferase